MIKVLVISGAVIVMLYKFFGVNFLAVLGIIVLALMALIYLNQNKLLYIPVMGDMGRSPSSNPLSYQHPDQQACNTEDISIRTADGVNLRGWLLKGDRTNRLIVYFHENAGNIGWRIPFIKQIHERTNSDVLLMAYRGYSDSEGAPTEEGLQRDALAVLDWAVDYKDRHANSPSPKTLYILGRSLGGAVTLFGLTHHSRPKQIDGILLENTFTSIKDMVAVIFPVLVPFTSLLQRNFWPSKDRIQQIKQPILFLQSMKDEIVPPSQMQELIERASSCRFKQVYRIQKGSHNANWEYNPDQYFHQYHSFFEKVQGIANSQPE